MNQPYGVIIAGAGPIGLFLACELGLVGTSVLVLERDINPESPWKVAPLGRRGLNTQSAEGFYRRGLLGQFFDLKDRPLAPKKASKPSFAGHFAGIILDGNKIELDRWKYRLPGPALLSGPTTMQCVEQTLAERAESLGVTILRGHGVTEITAQDDQSVTVQANGQSFQGRWLVGCDGGRSLIRKAAGFDFVGTNAKFTGYVVECDMEEPERLKQGFQITGNGMYIRMPGTLYLLDFDGGSFDRTQEVTKEHLQNVLNRVSRIPDAKITDIKRATSFTDRSKQVTSYRKGRVLLAGDAAHIHSPLGAQGLNVGLGDAMNLGWKLAATVREESAGQTDLALLDTYEAERHPIAAWVLEWTRAQVLTLQPDLFGSAIRMLIRDLISTTDGTNLLIDRVWGLSQRYTLGDGGVYEHPLVGSSTPDFEFDDGTRLGSKLEGGRGLLIDFENDGAFKGLIVGGKYEATVDYIGMGAKDTRDLRALLVRPDGIVAWLAERNESPDFGFLKTSLEKWFGP
ncbi:uncharacterized protein N7459_001490 [Penicillium hispanicum]|uniref:uncharacterized protein n=1 Tax=Penicillium hispanicum TaxID=1080232 RepID=UPI0025404B08|nr:uncharacterized protein N7459_001490 [Penicillium hispanicum]KAJ5595282.1 hypothetical protein N7459_001490 [Penicillium hispanicum]